MGLVVAQRLGPGELSEDGLSPEASRRRQVVREGVVAGWAAASGESDFERTLSLHEPDAVVEWPPEFVALGWPERVEGRDAYLQAWRGFREAWSDYQLTPEFIIDFGDRILVLGDARASGNASGVEVEFPVAQIFWESPRGLVARERIFTDWSEGLEFVGLPPGALAEIEALEPGQHLVFS